MFGETFQEQKSHSHNLLGVGMHMGAISVATLKGNFILAN